MKLNYQVQNKERIYFGILSAISLLFYGSLAGFFYKTRIYIYNEHIRTILFYIFIFFIFTIISMVLLVGMVRGNAIKVSEEQFPELFKIVNSQSKALGLKRIPHTYVMQEGGIINAFAFSFIYRPHVVLYAPVVEAAFKEGEDVLAFIVGHELGHIKRRHVGFLKTILTFPGRVIFPLALAYSRACEYTCDSIGYALSPSGAIKGMSLLAVGGLLYKKVNHTAWIDSAKEERGFSTLLHEIFSTHPHLVQRVRALSWLEKTKK